MLGHDLPRYQARVDAPYALRAGTTSTQDSRWVVGQAEPASILDPERQSGEAGALARRVDPSREFESPNPANLTH